MSDYRSWGNYPNISNKVLHINWQHETPFNNSQINSILTYGNGRSYGDSCLNKLLISTSFLNRFISFDSDTGLLCCESGTLLSDIISHFAPLGWFPEVVPGTKFVTIGGAIANDIHSKNHHQAGTFGNNVISFEILKSDGSRTICSSEQNQELFQATIGGLGITGLITWAKIKLKKIQNLYLDVETIKFSSLNEFFSIAEESNLNFEYTVAWIDCMTTGRGHFIRGNHNHDPELKLKHKSLKLNVPLYLPEFVLNKFSMKAISEIYYQRQFDKIKKQISHYNPFFFPLDGILNWNKVYGKRGFFQHQSVIPWGIHKEVIAEMLKEIKNSSNGTFLSVLKTFGDIKSPGLISFPMPGVTLAVDFANCGEQTISLMKKLEKIAIEAGGRLYPAKDALMQKDSFIKSYPNLKEFVKFKDPLFSSSFWERMTNE